MNLPFYDRRKQNIQTKEEIKGNGNSSSLRRMKRLKQKFQPPTPKHTPPSAKKNGNKFLDELTKPIAKS